VIQNFKNEGDTRDLVKKGVFLFYIPEKSGVMMGVIPGG